MAFASPKPAQDWHNFQTYLERVNGKNTVPIRLSHAKRYAHVLTTGNAQELLSLPDSTRQNVMKSLVLLSKYWGCYNHWKEIKDRYQLKWSNDDGLQAFNEILNGKSNYTAMLEWLRDTCSKIPKSYANILIFNTLTGLRPDEACQSIHLIKTGSEKYLNDERLILEHFNYKEVFIRRTKKAYISLVTPEILGAAKDAEDCGYNALRLIVKRRSLDMNMAFCRKIFSTYLRMNGVESELIDLLQGRIPKAVFARHYFRPDFDKEVKRIRKVISKLSYSL